MNTEARVQISVAIPVFNGMPFIKEAVSSALDQLGSRDELIVVDNASTDGTGEYLASIADRRVRLVARSDTQSVGDNWSQAIRETRGDYVKLICGDDVINPHCLERQAGVLMADPTVVLVASKRVVVDKENSVLLSSHGLQGLSGSSCGREAIRKCLLSGTNLLGEPAAVLFRGDAIRGAMPWEDRWPYVLDLATYARLTDVGKFVFIDEPLAKFRVSSQSWSSQILGQQPEDFRSWRNWIRRQLDLPWGARDELRAEVNLRARAVARRFFFWRAARRDAQM